MLILYVLGQQQLWEFSNNFWFFTTDKVSTKIMVSKM